MLNLVGMLVVLAVMEKSGVIGEARRAMVEADLGGIVHALEEYRGAERGYPETLLVLQRRRGILRPLGIIDQSAGLFATRTYEYVRAADGLSYDLLAVGKDGMPGTPDDVRPVLPDSTLAKAGYRPVR